MDSSAANTTNLQSTNYIPNPNIGEINQPVSQPTVTNVDMTNVDNNASQQATKTETAEKPKGYDSENTSIPTSYIQKHMSGLNKPDMFRTNDNGDSYNLTNVLSNTNGIKNAFTNQVRHDMEFQNNFNKARELFASLDTQNYKYIQDPIRGYMRIPIDADGKYIGLPEPINETGNPFKLEDPVYIHTYQHNNTLLHS